MTDRRPAPTVLVAAGVVAPLLVGAGLAIAALAHSPLASDAVAEPTIGAVARAERFQSQVATARWVPAERFAVRSQSAGTLTSVSIRPGVALRDGDVAMRVNAAPIRAYVADAPLYRDLSAGMSGADVRTAQRFLVGRGYLARADGTVGTATVRAITTFNRDHGHGEGGTLRRGSLLWVPKGSRPPVSVTARVGDTVTSTSRLYTTSTSRDQVVVSVDPTDSDRTLAVADAHVRLPAGSTTITTPADVAALRAAMSGQASAAATLTSTSPREVGTVPASAVITDAAGRSCFFAGIDAPAVPIQPDAGTFGLVDVSPSLIGTPVLVDPRRNRQDLSCG